MMEIFYVAFDHKEGFILFECWRIDISRNFVIDN